MAWRAGLLAKLPMPLLGAPCNTCLQSIGHVQAKARPALSPHNPAIHMPPTDQPAGRGAGRQARCSRHEGAHTHLLLRTLMSCCHMYCCSMLQLLGGGLCTGVLANGCPCMQRSGCIARLQSTGVPPLLMLTLQGNRDAGRPGGGGCIINVSSVAGLIVNVTTFGDPAFISAGGAAKDTTVFFFACLAIFCQLWRPGFHLCG